MEKPLKGDVVVLPFPFTDLSASKKRPAIVAASLKGDDLILCQITSRQINDEYSLNLNNSDFQSGSLNVISTIRPNRLFTADRSLILYKAGSVNKKKLKEVEASLIKIFRE
ncbi:type II toxin-antitoxin system PemK/MazF family toxin [Candidatus Woesearchaeota archaeon]|nr:type II toxin-antitoxin system PemK/MazF family toxin [Candidatus Woesearchaeota archaeon]